MAEICSLISSLLLIFLPGINAVPRLRSLDKAESEEKVTPRFRAQELRFYVLFFILMVNIAEVLAFVLPVSLLFHCFDLFRGKGLDRGGTAVPCLVSAFVVNRALTARCLGGFRPHRRVSSTCGTCFAKSSPGLQARGWRR